MQNTENRLLTRSEVEQIFGISKRYLETCTAHDTGPRLVRFGRLVRYRVKDIEAWIEANSSGGGGANGV